MESGGTDMRERVAHATLSSPRTRRDGASVARQRARATVKKILVARTRNFCGERWKAIDGSLDG
jgi:hypothetical protein